MGGRTFLELFVLFGVHARQLDRLAVDEHMRDQTNGKVFIELKPYHYSIKGIESANDLMNSKFGDYGEMNLNWSGQDVRGFTKVLATQIKLFHSVNKIDHD